MIFRAVHFGRPIPQTRARAGRHGFYHCKRSSAYRHEIIQTLVLAAGTDFVPIDYPCRVSIKVSGARLNSDTDNHAKMVLDCLQYAKVLADDSLRIVCKLEVEVDMGSKGACTVIEIDDYQGVKPPPPKPRGAKNEETKNEFREKRFARYFSKSNQ